MTGGALRSASMDDFDLRMSDKVRPLYEAVKAFIRDEVAKRDKRIGACADLGHWQTSGLKAIDCLKILEGRIMSVHLKERAALGAGQHDTIFGTGITDMAGVLAELKRQKFTGNISIEYEFNWDNSVPDIKQCIEFVRASKAK